MFRLWTPFGHPILIGLIISASQNAWNESSIVLVIGGQAILLINSFHTLVEALIELTKNLFKISGESSV